MGNLAKDLRESFMGLKESTPEELAAAEEQNRRAAEDAARQAAQPAPQPETQPAPQPATQPETQPAPEPATQPADGTAETVAVGTDAVQATVTPAQPASDAPPAADAPQAPAPPADVTPGATQPNPGSTATVDPDINPAHLTESDGQIIYDPHVTSPSRDPANPNEHGVDPGPQTVWDTLRSLQAEVASLKSQLAEKPVDQPAQANVEGHSADEPMTKSGLDEEIDDQHMLEAVYDAFSAFIDAYNSIDETEDGGGVFDMQAYNSLCDDLAQKLKDIGQTFEGEDAGDAVESTASAAKSLSRALIKALSTKSSKRHSKKDQEHLNAAADHLFMAGAIFTASATDPDNDGDNDANDPADANDKTGKAAPQTTQKGVDDSLLARKRDAMQGEIEALEKKRQEILATPVPTIFDLRSLNTDGADDGSLIKRYAPELASSLTTDED